MGWLPIEQASDELKASGKLVILSNGKGSKEQGCYLTEAAILEEAIESYNEVELDEGWYTYHTEHPEYDTFYRRTHPKYFYEFPEPPTTEKD